MASTIAIPKASDGRAKSARVQASKRLENQKGFILDVGCGENKHPGAVGMDIQDLPGVDVRHDWNDLPWPFEDESCLTVLASHVVEHVPRGDGQGFLRWMDEIWRILKPERQLALVTPYAGSIYFDQDPTHVNPCTERTWAYFDPMHEWGFYPLYSPKPWKVEVNVWNSTGMLEVVMRKRSEDPDTWQ